MQLVSDTQTLRDEINNLAVLMGLDKPCYSEMLDFTIDLFETQGLGIDYYGYHNIEHELEVTYITLVAANLKSSLNPINQDDLKYLYTSALFHDFDPDKSVDKPHEESVLKFLSESETLKKFLNDAEIDLNIIKALILRTTFPWKGNLKENAEKEIQIHADFVYENLKIVPTIEQNITRTQDDFVKTLHEIYDELPRPLQMTRNNFEESVRDPYTILSTIRLTDAGGPIIGFAKGGPLENYEILHQKVNDENFGAKNTIFLEPLAIKMGYWGHRGGSELRHLFTMQAHSKRYKYQTSFALRDVISKRAKTHEEAKFVTQFDPERWDYYRIEL